MVSVRHVYCKVYYTCDSFRGASNARYSRCPNSARVDVGLSVSVTVRVPSNKVRVLVFLTKNVV